MSFNLFMCRIILICCLMCVSLLGNAQSRKVQNLLAKADEAFQDKSFAAANDLYLKAYSLGDSSARVLFKLGKIESLKRNEIAAYVFFEKTIAADPQNPQFTEAHTFLGLRELKAGNYTAAKSYLTFTLENTATSSMLYHNIIEKVAQCERGIAAKNNALVIYPVKLPEQINQRMKQYFPVFTADNQTLFFTAVDGDGDENIYSSSVEAGEFGEPKLVNGGINSAKNEGTCSISSDGRTMVFTSCEGRSSYGGCDLYIAQKTGGEWSTPQNLGDAVNSPYWESQPALSSDGKLLFFASERPNGYGGKDLWVSQFSNSNAWTPAVNLGRTINSAADEISPFMHANGSTLFFASNGAQSFGGFDILMTNLVDGNFDTPQNLGYPINDATDQVSLFVTSDGKKAFYATDNKKRVDLFSFEIPEEIKAKYKKVNYLQGLITDKGTGFPQAATIQLIDLRTQKVLSSVTSDSVTGAYMIVLPHGNRYGIHVNKENYLFKSINFDVTATEKAEGKELNLSLEPIKRQANTVLSNIFFDSGSAELREESYFELDKLAALLAENPKVKAEIKGHTDDVGNESDNLKLSQTRAEAVVAYLVSKSISPDRIAPIGYGESTPLFPNENEINRQLNRRIEFTIQ